MGEHEPFAFDEPLLRFAESLHGDVLDRTFVFISEAGYAYGVVPFDIILIAALAWCRRLREGLFAGIAIIGSAPLSLATKQIFARDRPSLWESTAPETAFSFPTGHAMSSTTLTWVLLLLAWHTRWRPAMGHEKGDAG